jgi:hypothetical protein
MGSSYAFRAGGRIGHPNVPRGRLEGPYSAKTGAAGVGQPSRFSRYG